MGIESVTKTVRRELRVAEGRFFDALPTILVYIVMFIGVTLAFGSEYTLIVSSAVATFIGRRAKENTIPSIVGLFFMTILLSVLGHIATLNLALCILLNATVPPLLVLAQSSQFIPKGHFGLVMTFVFMELKPLSPSEFLIQLQATTLVAALLALAIVLWRLWQNREEREDITDASLDALAYLFDHMAEGGDPAELQAGFLDLERTFDRLRITRHHFLRTPDRREFIYTMYALLFQRAVYLVSDLHQLGPGPDAETIDPEVPRALARFARQAKAASTPDELASLARLAQATLDVVDLPEGRTRIFFRSFLHMFALILRIQASPERTRTRLPWKLIPWRDVERDLERRAHFDSYEFRFGCRLAVVLTVSCAVNLLWNFEHTYWFPMTAFLLLMPSYEESTHRMRTRPIGTFIGCGVTYVILELLPANAGVPVIFTICLVFISILYCSPPGSWQQAVFATTFALLMTSLTMPAATAMWLRCLFTLMAVALVLVVNRFVAPSHRDRIFEANMRELRELVQRYWATVRRSIDTRVSLFTTGELLTEFHMVYAEARAYIMAMPEGPERTRLRKNLVILWHLFSEVEQVEYLVLTESLGERDAFVLKEAAEVLQNRPRPTTCHELLCQTAESMDSQELRYVLTHYLEHASEFAE